MASETPPISFHEPLQRAKEKAQSRDSKMIEDAIADMTRLKDEFPYAVQIEQELALAHIELYSLPGCRDYPYGQDHLQKAFRILDQLCEDRSFADEETLGKTGRFFKEKAWSVATPFFTPNAERMVHYKNVLTMYERAFNESDKPDMQYYCGINVATLRFLLGRNDYREVAERILRICSDINPKDDVEKNWVFATQGEAHLLLRRYDQATRNYQRAMVYDHTEA